MDKWILKRAHHLHSQDRRRTSMHTSMSLISDIPAYMNSSLPLPLLHVWRIILECVQLWFTLFIAGRMYHDEAFSLYHSRTHSS